jgi:hypothetical protein
VQEITLLLRVLFSYFYIVDQLVYNNRCCNFTMLTAVSIITSSLAAATVTWFKRCLTAGASIVAGVSLTHVSAAT